eukprot:Hpha_TRINITY_DN30713_c0_g1::TRINITY_DN30713_c0_g1_i1::g.28268::m.28268
MVRDTYKKQSSSSQGQVSEVFCLAPADLRGQPVSSEARSRSKLTPDVELAVTRLPGFGVLIADPSTMLPWNTSDYQRKLLTRHLQLAAADPNSIGRLTPFEVLIMFYFEIVYVPVGFSGKRRHKKSPHTPYVQKLATGQDCRQLKKEVDKAVSRAMAELSSEVPTYKAPQPADSFLPLRPAGSDDVVKKAFNLTGLLRQSRTEATRRRLRSALLKNMEKPE